MCPVWPWPPFQLYTGAEMSNKLSGGKHSNSTRQVELKLSGPPPSQLWSSCVCFGVLIVEIKSRGGSCHGPGAEGCIL